MSRISFEVEKDNATLEVTAGWDGPFAAYFLQMWENEENPIYTSDYDHPYKQAQNKDNTEALQKKLAEMGIEPPEGFWELASKRDRKLVATYQTGTWVTA